MSSILILPCWYGSPEQHWYPWVKAELEKKGHSVSVPDLPTIRTDLPDPEPMLRAVAELNVLTPDTVVIGHSLGCLLGLRLAEQQVFRQLILVAGWDFNDLTSEHRLFWPQPINHQAVIDHTKRRVCFTSDNDPYFTPFTVKDMSKRLQAEYVEIPGAGHFTKEFGVTELPKLLDFVE